MCVADSGVRSVNSDDKHDASYQEQQVGDGEQKRDATLLAGSDRCYTNMYQ